MAAAAQPRSIFEILPPELLYYVLDFMEEGEYGGFSCTCHRALAIVNAYVDTKCPFLRYDKGPEKSLSGKMLRLRRHYESEMQSTVCYDADHGDDL
jgi:hypothetical protein